MENYRIAYDDKTRDAILDIVKNFSNDILINNVEDNSVGITIELEEAEPLYQRLLGEIERKVYLPGGDLYTFDHQR